MTHDDILRMAKAAHKAVTTWDYPGHMGQLDPWTLALCERFANIVIAEKDKEIERLREALKKYGQHRSDCAITLGGYQCTCGFNQQG